MKYNPLGKTELQVSEICLGTMTWGEQNSAAEAFIQMNYALENGINFFDTAELYAIPPKAETYGATESTIGQWFKETGNREQVILASKVCGPTDWCPHIRDGKARLNRNHIIEACEGSLRRLNTDYIDLYQTHWPDRNCNYFGKLDYRHKREESATAIDETLEALKLLVDSGKVRHIGVSNETPWGTMQHLQFSESLGLPRIASIQNPYNLLNRSYEIGLAEISCREEVGLLAYSPLAFGTLSGKYLNGNRPSGSRLSLFEHYGRYSNDRGKQATQDYVELAVKQGLDPAQMALAFIRQQPFVASTIIGATTQQQLADNIASHRITLSDACISEIQSIHNSNPNPCP